MKESVLVEQIETLATYIAEGGSAREWLRSKDFSPLDRKRILQGLRMLAEKEAEARGALSGPVKPAQRPFSALLDEASYAESEDS